ncbi:unnamed protein product [Taenia asiatica]|uniref:Uncharacterized protein n=1 Tax=Taenia asiatica TaxID=60517 RepID=A0A0R3W3Q8_TAEAS|nr:unnamed protein product [Taenia asiatica]
MVTEESLLLMRVCNLKPVVYPVHSNSSGESKKGVEGGGSGSGAAGGAGVGGSVDGAKSVAVTHSLRYNCGARAKKQ